jgi:hypothetical protein
MKQNRITCLLIVGAGVVVAAGSILIAVVIAARHVHYDWESKSLPPPDTLTGITRLTISHGTELSFEVTDPSEIASFAEFISRGTYEHMDKSGYGYLIRVKHSSGEAEYYNHGDALGPKPGGFIQVVFVPAKPGFQNWFEELLRQPGHETKRRPSN